MKATELSHKAFDALTRDEQKQAIFDLADEGFGDYGIAAATKLSVEQVRQILAERNQ